MSFLIFQSVNLSGIILILMVPLSARRHRLYNHEIPEVKRGFKLRLQELCEAGEDQEVAEIAFRGLFRFSRDEPGRPKYPEFTWGNLQYYLDYHKDE
jgi:hypothetical protein